MKIKKNVILALDLISEGYLFFMKLLIWPIFLIKESKDADGVIFQWLSAFFISLEMAWIVTIVILFGFEYNFAFWFNFKIAVIGHFIFGLAAYFKIKEEFGESFLT